MVKRSDNFNKSSIKRFKFTTSKNWLTSAPPVNHPQPSPPGISEDVADMIADELGLEPEDITDELITRLDNENTNDLHYHTEDYYEDINALTNLATSTLGDLGLDINNLHRKIGSVMAQHYRDMAESGKTYNVTYKDQNDADAYKTYLDKSGLDMARLLGEVLRDL